MQTYIRVLHLYFEKNTVSLQNLYYMYPLILNSKTQHIFNAMQFGKQHSVPASIGIRPESGVRWLARGKKHDRRLPMTGLLLATV